MSDWGSALTPSSCPGDAVTVLHEAPLAQDGNLWEQAFPASVWRDVLPGAVVRAEVQGPAADSAVLHAAIGATALEIGRSPTGQWDVPLGAACADWYWFEIPGAVEARSATRVRWTARGAIVLPPVTVIMPSFRREAEAAAQALRFAEMDVVQQVLVIDQGSTLAEEPSFTAVMEGPEAGGKIRLLTQSNLGGSGGFARGMLESLDRPGDAIFLGDDDAILSAESLRRMATYQALAGRAGRPTIVGSGMRDAAHPSRLVCESERVRAADFYWTPADRLRGRLELRGTTPDRWSDLATTTAPNYTGWWGTLLPPGTVREVGLPAPYFLKWDDAEYGLRATERGYGTVVLPGASVAHPTWTAAATQMTWPARLMHRNRLATAAAHGAGRGVIAASFVHQVKHVVAGHHLTSRLWADGIDEFLAGPETWLGTDMDRARSNGQRIADDYWREQAAFVLDPQARRLRPLPLVQGAVRAVASLLRADREPRGVVLLTANEFWWRSTLGADAVVITEPKGAERRVFRVTGSGSRALLRRTAVQHLNLLRRWPSLRRRYRSALDRTTTAAYWWGVIGADDTPGGVGLNRMVS